MAKSNENLENKHNKKSFLEKILEKAGASFNKILNLFMNVFRKNPTKVKPGESTGVKPGESAGVKPGESTGVETAPTEPQNLIIPQLNRPKVVAAANRKKPTKREFNSVPPTDTTATNEKSEVESLIERRDSLPKDQIQR